MAVVVVTTVAAPIVIAAVVTAAKSANGGEERFTRKYKTCLMFNMNGRGKVGLYLRAGRAVETSRKEVVLYK